MNTVSTRWRAQDDRDYETHTERALIGSVGKKKWVERNAGPQRGELTGGKLGQCVPCDFTTKNKLCACVCFLRVHLVCRIPQLQQQAPDFSTHFFFLRHKHNKQCELEAEFDKSLLPSRL